MNCYLLVDRHGRKSVANSKTKVFLFDGEWQLYASFKGFPNVYQRRDFKKNIRKFLGSRIDRTGIDLLINQWPPVKVQYFCE